VYRTISTCNACLSFSRIVIAVISLLVTVCHNCLPELPRCSNITPNFSLCNRLTILSLTSPHPHLLNVKCPSLIFSGAEASILLACDAVPLGRHHYPLKHWELHTLPQCHISEEMDLHFKKTFYL